VVVGIPCPEYVACCAEFYDFVEEDHVLSNLPRVRIKSEESIVNRVVFDVVVSYDAWKFHGGVRNIVPEVCCLFGGGASPAYDRPSLEHNCV